MHALPSFPLFLSFAAQIKERFEMLSNLCFTAISCGKLTCFYFVAIQTRGDTNFLRARQEAKKGELDEQLKEYINEWRKQRAKEEEELKRLKEKQAKRKEIR